MSAPERVLPEPTYTVREVAQVLKVSYEQARGLCNAGDIPSIYVGRYIRVPAEAFAEYLKRHQITS